MSSATGKFSLVENFCFCFCPTWNLQYYRGKEEGILKINQEKKNLIYKKKSKTCAIEGLKKNNKQKQNWKKKFRRLRRW